MFLEIIYASFSGTLETPECFDFGYPQLHFSGFVCLYCNSGTMSVFAPINRFCVSCPQDAFKVNVDNGFSTLYDKYSKT